VIGECYIHGKSNGEPFVGLYSEKTARVSRYVSLSRSWTDAFFTESVDGFIIEDSRVGLLQNGWRFKSHQYGHIWNDFERIEPVEPRDHGRKETDSSWSIEALTGRGLDIQMVKLL